MASPRIILYSHDAHGLGHTSRALKIATFLSQAIEKVSILLLTDLSIVGKYKLPANVDYVHLPGVVSDGDTRDRPRNLNIRFKKALRIRCKIAQSAANTFKPQLILVDRDPLRIPKESTRTLSFIRDVLPRTKIVWGLMDTLGEAKEICREWEKRRIYRMLHHLTDELWVYGDRDLFDVAANYKFPDNLRKRLFYTGYFDARHLLDSSKPKDYEQFIKNKPVVVLAVGSGADGAMLVDTFLSYLEQCGDDCPYQSLIVTGPMMSSTHKKSFMKRAAKLPDVTLHRFTKHLLQYLKLADVVVGTGGHNTLSEIFSFEKRAIIVPPGSMPLEHLTRAEIFAKRHMIQLVRPGELSAESLGQAIHSAIEPREAAISNKAKTPSMDGFAKIAERIQNFTGPQNNIMRIAS